MKEEFYISINEYKVFIKIKGNLKSSKTILFLHGASMNHLAMEGLDVNLKEKYRCVYFDFFGHGKTKGKIPNNIKKYISYTNMVIYKLKEEGCLTEDTILVGYSLGGRLSLDVCIHQFPFIKQAILLHVCDFSLVSVWTQFKKIIKKPHKIISTVFGEESKPLYVVYRLLHPKNNFFTIFRDFLTIMQSNPVHLKEIKIPITFITSDKDFFCPLEKVEEWHNEIQSSDLQVLYGKGHTAILEVPEVYSTCILLEIEKLENKKR